MNIAEQHISAIERLGYTGQEAQFLYLVATFSGYFLPRQFVAFARIKWGRRSSNFSAKLESRGHATWREYLSVGGVYHLFSKTLYRVIDRENLRNHRRHSIEFIRTRILLLDFVLANQDYQYLENQEQKVRYFHQELGLQTGVLPSKEYACRSNRQSSVRYFVDGFPIFFETPEDRAAQRVTFSYVDAGAPTLAAFSHHLRLYGPLLGTLPRISVVYISNSTVHFRAAEKRFRCYLKQIIPTCDPSDLLRYFRLRFAWDAKRYGSLSTQDIEWLENARVQFRTAEIEDLFGPWAAGSISDDAVTQSLSTRFHPSDASFYPRLIVPGPANREGLPERGEA